MRAFFGGLLVMTAFVAAVLLAAEWLVGDRPAAWLERVADCAVQDARVAWTPPHVPGAVPVPASTAARAPASSAPAQRRVASR